MVLTIKPGPTKTTIYRSDFALFHTERLSDFVYSGFTCTDGGALNLTVATGIAYISGWRVAHSEANTIVLADDATNYIYLDKDGDFTANVTGVAPSDSILLATVVVASGVISIITDSRPTTLLAEGQVLFTDTGGHDHAGSGNKGTKVDHDNLDNATTDQHHPKNHPDDHADGGAQEITLALDPRAYPMLADVVASRPAAGVAGRFFWATDEGILYRDNGSSWDKGAVSDHPDLDDIDEDDHHAALIGLEDNAGTAIPPEADNRIQVTDDGVVNADESGGKLALSFVCPEKTDGQLFIGIALFEPVSGTWAAALTGDVPSLDRTAADANHDVVADLPLRNRTAASKGVKVTSIEVFYEVATADIDDLTVTINKYSLPATGNAMSVSSVGFSYDEGHDTVAERKATGHHTLVCTITSPAYLGDDEGLTVKITVDGSATGVVKLKGLQVYYTETLI